MIAHLIVSTLVLVIVLIAARVLPLAARTRHALLCCGLLKFAVPTAIFQLLPSTAVPAPLRILGSSGGAPAPPSAASHPQWLAVAWAAIALLLFASWIVRSVRTRRAALANCEPASERETRAVAHACSALGIRRTVTIVRSRWCEAAAVVGVVHPVVVLPLEPYEDEQLRALLLHECAHIARHDNVTAIAQALATSLLWFHPLVWFASRELTRVREEAADADAADAMHDRDAYASALLSICRNLAAPPATGASCAASSNFSERIRNLMRYESIPNKAWPHRIMLAFTLFLIGITTVAATSGPAAKPYVLRFAVAPQGDATLSFRFDVRDAARRDDAGHSIELSARPGEPARARFGSVVDGRDVEFTVDVHGTREAGEVIFTVRDDGKEVQRDVQMYTAKTARPAEPQYTGERITLQLKDATLRDFMNTLGLLTGYAVTVDPAIAENTLTVDLADVPWDQALDVVARQNRLTVTIEGKRIRVAPR